MPRHARTPKRRQHGHERRLPSPRVRGTRITATDAPGPVGRIRLVDSVVTSNDASSYMVDIWANRRPQLINTTCGRSGGPFSSDLSWCVSANDPTFYCF
jgi:hypothetical protein